jgi:hypothetical protein
MKRTRLLAVALIISLHTLAQTDTTNNPENKKEIKNRVNNNQNNNSNTNDGMNTDNKNSREAGTDNMIQNTNPNYDKTNNANTSAPDPDKVYSDGVLMKEGKLMMVTNGNITLMVNDHTMPNGTVIKTNGIIMDKNNTFINMKNGDQMDMEGNLIPNRTIAPKK